MKKISLGILVLSSMLFGESIRFYEYVTVEKSTPIYKNITKKMPYTETYTEMVQKEVSCGNQPDTNSLGLDTLLGATLGVIVGHQIGSGNGKVAAKIIGGLGGGYIANNMRDGGETCIIEEAVDKTVTKYEVTTEKRLVGYKNIAYYNDQRIVKKSDRKLNEIRLNLTIKY